MKRATFLLALLFLASAPLFALKSHHGSNGQDHVGIGNTITIDEGQSTGDIVCAFCTVRVHGDVHGDIVTFFGDVQVDSNHSLAGDAVVFGGNLGLGDQSQVNGDLVLFGGDIHQPASASVHGSRVVFAGSGWLMVLLSPLLIPIGIVWLIIHLVRRQRYHFPAYPPARF